MFCRLDIFINIVLDKTFLMPKTMVKTPEELIVEHLDANGQKLSWLADKIQCSVGHLHSVLKGDEFRKRELTEENRKRINEALGTDF